MSNVRVLYWYNACGNAVCVCVAAIHVYLLMFNLSSLLFSYVLIKNFRFPNMVVGNITRDSVRQALMHGIKSEQVSGVCYLSPLVMQVAFSYISLAQSFLSKSV